MDPSAEIPRRRSPLPWSIRLLAYAILLTAAGLLGSAVAERSLEALIAAPLWALLGWGLFARRNAARLVAKFFAGFYSFGGAFMIFVSLVIPYTDGFHGTNGPFGVRIESPVLATLSGVLCGVAIGLIAFKLYKKLSEKTVAEQFEDPTKLQLPAIWRFSTKTLLLVVPLVVAFSLPLSSRFGKRILESFSTATSASDGSAVHVQYGVSRLVARPANAHLGYVVISRGMPGQTLAAPLIYSPKVTDWHEIGVTSIRVHGANLIEVTDGQQLFDYRDGQLTPRQGRVEVDEFEAYLSRNDKSRFDWSIDGLLEFVEQRRAQEVEQRRANETAADERR